MTTNQTIDGVPRERLKSLVEIAISGRASAGEVKELRALLDAPVIAICRGCFTEQPVGKACKTCAEVEAQRAAQPQGEPVVLSPARDERPNSIAKPVTRRVCHACVGLHREVFCPICDGEQPAPVAVAMPERKHVPDFRHHPMLNKEYTGWNACLDELKRLNHTL